MKDATICNCTAGTSFKFAATFIGLMLVAVLLAPAPAAATGCAQDVLPVGSSLNCTAKEVTPAVVSGSVVVLDDGCTSTQDDVTFTFDVAFTNGTGTLRTDVGIFISTDGDPNLDSARTGICENQAGPIPPFVDQDNQTGDFCDNGFCNITGASCTTDADCTDTCGDIPSGGTVTHTIAALTVACADADDDGFLDVPTCLTWEIPGRDEFCDGPEDTAPSNPAKCNCDPITVTDIPVPCDDGDFCNGEEFRDGNGECQPGTPPVCDDGAFCNGDEICNEETDSCDSGTPPVCDDGAFCNGDEICNETTDSCDSGIPVDCSNLDDQCNTGVCNEDENKCEAIPFTDNTQCDDGDNCTGDPQGGIDLCLGGICQSVPVDCSALDDSCNDGVCNAGTGVCEAIPVADSTPCEDGDACTSETGAEASPDHCLGGVCTGVPVGCGPGDDCNTDECNPATGTCEFVPIADSTPCEDGDACTSETGAEASPDHCLGGVCTGVPVGCGPGDDCNTDECNPATGTCEFVPIADSTPCEDGDACTSETGAEASPDHCLGGVCTGVPVGCGPGDDCNTDECNPATGTCEFVPIADSTPCEDGDACTSETGAEASPDHCLGGVCTGVPVGCGPGDDCNTDECNPATGTCEFVPIADSTPCEDGDACTSETGAEASPDHCLGGVCTGVPVGCGPGDDCNTDECNPATGTCEFVPIADSTPCEDGDACTSETGAEASPDHCLGGVCTGVPVGCGPGDDCNTDECNPATGTCEFVPIADSTPCEDGDACTSETGAEASPDHCLGGVCTGVPVGCGPGDDCNTDECNPATGTCEFVPIADSTPCEDGDACTSETGAEASPDHCLGGVCTGVPVGCGPGDDCNTDECNPATGTCEFVPIADSTPCEDGDACTSETGAEASPDHCLGGVCTGVPVGCGPGDDCNTDECNPATGTCEFVPIADSTPCEDGDACTSETGAEASPDHCLGGVCTGVPVGCGPGDDCNTDECNPATGTCEFVPIADSTPCEDGDACTSETGAEASPDHCLGGVCTGVPVGCGPGDDCNTDECNPATGTCEFVPIADSTPCEDGDACTSETGAEASPDHCLGGVCTGVPVGCGPGDDCNTDECNPATGTCEFVPIADSTPCEDGDACTSETGAEASPDHCLGGVCTGVPVGCGPGDDCNTDECNPATGTCEFVPIADSTPCEDGDFCTSETGTPQTPDHCVDGTCTGVPVGCDDTVTECTDADTCDPDDGACLANNKECGFVTNSSLCPFDVNPNKGQCVEVNGDPTGEKCDPLDGDPACITGTCEQTNEFRLLFTPDVRNWVAYKHNASNPGQYFYNLFLDGTPGETVPLDITVPYPFVTQGAMPLHVYDGALVGTGDTEGQTDCFLPPETTLGDSDLFIDVDDYIGSSEFGFLLNAVVSCSGLDCTDAGSGGADGVTPEATCVITADVPIPASGQVYVNLHLDWGLKRHHDGDINPCDTVADAYDPGTPDTVFGGWDALTDTEEDSSGTDVAIANCNEWEFSHLSGAFGDSVQNLNEFKHIAGAFGHGGQSNNGNPTPGLQAALVRNDTQEVKQTGVTDEDGYYTLVYKHRGRPALYTVYLFDPVCEAFLGGSLSQEVELQGNGWAEVNFDTFNCTSTAEYGKGRNKNKR